mmetsp:Transcript_81026/g.225485  ORF Transcript_81026/g.225485 Transcript_81026/m.225485 type:complete len:202 (-) Transcript_81026:544-1149(-)
MSAQVLLSAQVPTSMRPRMHSLTASVPGAVQSNQTQALVVVQQHLGLAASLPRAARLDPAPRGLLRFERCHSKPPMSPPPPQPLSWLEPRWQASLPLVVEWSPDSVCPPGRRERLRVRLQLTRAPKASPLPATSVPLLLALQRPRPPVTTMSSACAAKGAERPWPSSPTPRVGHALALSTARPRLIVKPSICNLPAPWEEV